MAIVNSFIWYSAAFPERKLSHYQFRERLVDDLVNTQLKKQVKEDANIFPRRLSKKSGPRSRAGKLVLIGQSNFGNQQTVELRAEIQPIQPIRGPGTGSEEPACFAADLLT